MALKSRFHFEYLGEGYNRRSGQAWILRAQSVRNLGVSMEVQYLQSGYRDVTMSPQQPWGTFYRHSSAQHSKPEQARKKGRKLKSGQEDQAKEPLSCPLGQCRGIWGHMCPPARTRTSGAREPATGGFVATQCWPTGCAGKAHGTTVVCGCSLEMSPFGSPT